jgi:RNA-binding protein
MPAPQSLSQALSPEERKHLRSIGHKLNPIVTIAEKGLSEGVAAELERALDDHELIKIKLAVADRELKAALIEEVCQAHNATAVQSIGKVALLLRRAKKPNPKLSNLLRNIE